LRKKYGDWGLGIGDWGLGDWGLGIGPNPQSPIPNPQFYSFYINYFRIKKMNNLKLLNFRI